MSFVYRRKNSLRLKGYDYSGPGAYFVTFRVKGRQCILGEIVNGHIHLSPIGNIVEGVWQDLPTHYPNVILDAFCVMPNHVHGIIVINDHYESAGASLTSVWVGFKPTQTIPSPAPAICRHGLPEIIRGFKTFSAKRINEYRNTLGIAFWQRNYYDHIIRNEDEWQRIADYIDANPACWETDRNIKSERLS